MSRLKDTVVLITGGAAGLGLALVRRFLLEGAQVAVLDRSVQRIEEGAKSFDARRTLWVAGDVTDYQANVHAVQETLKKFGRLDVFIGNAALWDYGRSLLGLTPDVIGEAFDELFAVNVKGYLFGARAAAQALIESRGAMIFTLSNAALYPGGGGPLYTASKHAGVGLVKQLAYELAPAVRVNAVAPAGMATELTGPPSLGLDRSVMKDNWDGNAFAARVPLGFVPSPDDYAAPYVMLASRQESNTMTGTIIPCELGLGVRGIKSVAGGAAP